MTQQYPFELKFKDQGISTEIHQACLFIQSDDCLFIRVYIDNNHPEKVESKFNRSSNIFGPFLEVFELIFPTTHIDLSRTEIFKIGYNRIEGDKRYFQLSVSQVWVNSKTRENKNERQGTVYLSRNGSNLLQLFHNRFWNLVDTGRNPNRKNTNMDEWYCAGDLLFYPEYEYISTEKRKTEKFEVERLPIISFYFKVDTNLAEIKKHLEIVCQYLSFMSGIRIFPEKIIYQQDEIKYTYISSDPDHRTYISKISRSFTPLLEHYEHIEEVLQTAWFQNYKQNEKTITKAIDSFLHSREVDSGASFLLLFHVLELFKENSSKSEFDLLPRKKRNKIFDVAFEAVKEILTYKEDIDEFKIRWEHMKNNLKYRPMKSPMRETLIKHNIEIQESKYDLDHLYKTRNDLSHGSTKFDEKKLIGQVYILRRIATMLILSNLGFKAYFKDNLLKL